MAYEQSAGEIGLCSHKEGLKMRKKYLAILLVVVFSGSQALFGAAGTTSATFLKIGIGAKNLAMGGVGATEQDADAIYYNPAGLAFIDQNEISVMHLQWFADINYDYLAFAMPYKKWGFAASYYNLSVGAIQSYDVNDNLLPNSYSPVDSCGSLAASVRLKDNLSCGLTVKYINSSIAGIGAATAAADTGIMLTGKSFDCGASVQNLGGTLKYVQTQEYLPLNLKVGAAYHGDPKKKITPKFYADVNQGIETEAYVSGGTEVDFHFSENLEAALRCGYKSMGQDYGVSGFSAGGGLTINKNINLDLAWIPYGDFGDTYAVSLIIKFEEILKTFDHKNWSKDKFLN